MTILMKIEKLIMQGTGVKKECYGFLIENQGQLLREVAEWYICGALQLESAVYMVKHW